MPLQASGQIAITDIQTFFGGGGTNIAISSYYKGGGLVPNIAGNSGVPTSGVISLSNFYGAVKTSSSTLPIKVGSGTFSTKGGGSLATGLVANTLVSGTQVRGNCSPNSFTSSNSSVPSFTNQLLMCYYKVVTPGSTNTFVVQTRYGYSNADSYWSTIAISNTTVTNTFSRSLANLFTASVTFTGTTTLNNNVITSLSSNAGITVGKRLVSSTGSISDDALVTAVNATAVTMSINATASSTGATIDVAAEWIYNTTTANPFGSTVGANCSTVISSIV